MSPLAGTAAREEGARGRRRLSSLLLVLASCAAAAPPPPAPPAGVAPLGATPAPAPAPPVARRQPRVTELHGDRVVDDYYWLREKGTPEVEAYLRSELAYAEGFMRPTEALQQRLYDEMLARVQQTDTEVPYRWRGHYYYSRTEEGKQYPIHCRKQGSLTAPEQILLDVNALALGKQFMSVGALEVSRDGNLLAYTSDETGFRQYTLRVRDLRNGKDGVESIPRVTSVAWFGDHRTLLYSVEDAVTKRSFQVFRRKLGEAKDELVHEERDERFSVYVSASRDEQILFVVSQSQTTSEVRYVPAAMPRAALTLIAPREQGHEYYADHRKGVFYIRTNADARNFRLVTAPRANPARRFWKELVAHREHVMLEDVDLFERFYVLIERQAGLPQLTVTDFASGGSHRVTFPEAAYAVRPDANHEWDATVYRFGYQSPITSRSVYDYDVTTRERTLLKQVPVLGGYDPSRYVVVLTAATAGDGARVPIWMVHKRGLEMNGRNPTLLYGYGSYGYPGAARFNSELFSLVDRGVVYATAYVRGGGELGKRWHDEGRMMNKRNTFTDFIAAAEHLVAEGYASPDRLAIEGGSAGGLLLGAVTNLRPELFRVVIAHVPFVDVVNTMLDESLPLTVGEFEEWGNPKVEAEYRYIKSYSPYDNLAAQPYPTMLVKTSYNDSQVMYWEPAKYVARLRTLKTDANPLVFHINMDPAGHGGKSGRYERLRERAFDYAFLLWQLGVEAVDAAPGAAGTSPAVAR